MKLNEGRHSSYLRYTPDAYRHAHEVEKRITETYGRGSEEALEWARGYHMVFGEITGEPEVPPWLSDYSPLMLRQERAYQIASAHFYAERFDEAYALFQAMADDPDSPYREMAPYLQARAMIRKGTLRPPKGLPFDREPLERARVLLEGLRSRGVGDPMYRISTELWLLVLSRVDPARHRQECSRILLMREPASLFKRAFEDYTFGYAPTVDAREGTTTASVGTDDLTDWIVSFRSAAPEAFDHAWSKWEETSSDAWLVAALQRASPTDGRVAEVIEAASAVAAGSPGFKMAQLHRSRLMAGSLRRR